MKNNLTICYFGIFDPHFSRNAVYIKGLRENGVNVIVCTDRSSGIKKYINIVKRFLRIKKEIDLIIVGYSGHIIVPFAKILSTLTIRKPVIFDALCSFYESNILSRDAFKKMPFRNIYAHFIDWLANKSADVILLETEKQKEYYIDKLKVSKEKCLVAYTGVDDSQFYYDQTIKKLDTFTVLFRGKFTPEAGLKYIIETARIIQQHGEKINFRIVGYGWGKINDDTQKKIKELKLKNLEFINKHLSFEELRKNILECHVSLGQFENHERLQRTIPHKAFEAMVMKIPYITGRNEPSKEILEDGKTCLFVNLADSEDLVNKILQLKNDRVLSDFLIKNGFELYQSKLIAKVLAKNLLSLLPDSH